MRRPYIAGNWKMNMLSADASRLAAEVAEGLKDIKDMDFAVAPPHTSLTAVAEAVSGSNVKLAAQNFFWEEKGAYTGEVSGPMLKDIGCDTVIIGHSERRQYFGETDDTVNKRLKAAFKYGLEPIVCVGETLEERESGKTISVIDRQVRGALDGISLEQAGIIVIAYEPVWAIGTGKTATSDQAEDVHKNIREIVSEIFDAETSAGMRIQYGGSVKPDNVKELMSQPDIDGALVGGASLKADSFIAIARNAR